MYFFLAFYPDLWYIIRVSKTNNLKKEQKMKYYVTPANALGRRIALDCKPVDMNGVDIVDLVPGDSYNGPAGDCIIGHDAKWAKYNGKEIPAENVAICVAKGQITKN